MQTLGQDKRKKKESLDKAKEKQRHTNNGHITFLSNF